MHVKRWWVPWLGLVVVVAVAVVALAVRSRPSRSPQARAVRLERQLACPVCTGETVADSDSSASRAIRADVEKRIAEGQSDATIRAAYVATYGDRILLTPGNGGIGLVAWGVPIAAVVIAGAGVVIALRRWSATPRLSATADDAALVAREQEARHGGEAGTSEADGE